MLIRLRDKKQGSLVRLLHFLTGLLDIRVKIYIFSPIVKMTPQSLHP